MTKYNITPRIRELIELADIPSDLRDKFTNREWISHSDIISLYKLRKASLKDDTAKSTEESILMYLKGTSIYREPQVVAPKSPEFLKQMEKLRLKQQEDEYRQLINGIPDSKVFKINSAIPGKDDDEYGDKMSIKQQTKELRHQLTTVVNILVSVVSVAYAVWYWTGTSMRINDALRVLIALFFAILVLVAEVVVFGGYLRKVDEAKSEERAKIETREVIDTTVFAVGKKPKTKDSKNKKTKKA